MGHSSVHLNKQNNGIPTLYMVCACELEGEYQIIPKPMIENAGPEYVLLADPVGVV